MYVIGLFLIAVVANNGVSTHKPPCSHSKTELEKTLTEILCKVLTVNGSKDCFDPLLLHDIHGKFSNLNYVCDNATLTGLRNCKVSKLKISPDIKSAEIVLDCSSFNFLGDGEFEGYFLYLPAKGCGEVSICFGRHVIIVYAQLKHVGGCGCNFNIQFGDFSLQPESKGKTVFKFEKILNGNEDVTAQRNAFANEHSDEMVFFAHGPLLYPVVQNLLTTCNKQLANMAEKK